MSLRSHSARFSRYQSDWADAIVVLPAVLAFCSLAMLIYTSRGLRYAPRKRSDTELVGNMPVPIIRPMAQLQRLLALLACLIMLLMPFSCWRR